MHSFIFIAGRVKRKKSLEYDQENIKTGIEECKNIADKLKMEPIYILSTSCKVEHEFYKKFKENNIFFKVDSQYISKIMDI